SCWLLRKSGQKMKKILFICCFFIFGQAVAQKLPLVTFSGKSASFSSIVDALEEQTDYRIFFKNEWVDSLRYDLSFSQAPLNEVLDRLVEGAKLDYYIDNKQVYFTNDVRIISNPAISALLDVKPSEIQANVEKGLVFVREYRPGISQSPDLANQVYEIGDRKNI